MFLFRFKNFRGFGLFFLWVSNPILINDSFSLSHNSTDLDFLCFFPRRFTGLKVKVYFVGDRFGCWVYGLVVLLEIWVWFFVGDWFCRRFVFLWLLGFVLIWRLMCVLHAWLLRKCKKRNKNIDFYNFLGNELFEEEHEQF